MSWHYKAEQVNWGRILAFCAGYDLATGTVGVAAAVIFNNGR
ncbi:hypothetical protein [Sedimenticola selenatireducens]|nr:hypothetical protein [Sedimenticola selenatireducens]